MAVYERIGDLSTTAFARGRLANTAYHAGDMTLYQEQAALLREFTERNGAVVLAAVLEPRSASGGL